MRKPAMILAALCLTALCLQGAAARDSAERHWVDSVYNRLSPRERVAQLFIPHLIVEDNQRGRAIIRKYVEKEKVGGILLGAGTVAGYASLNSYAGKLARVPLMITADAEWGLAMRLKDAPRFPHNIALGATADTAAIAAYGREMARECRRLGISVSFAPVADVNSNPLNPVIGFRSFGEDPDRVAALSLAYARGLAEGGVLPVGKHFPGHGDTSADSHKTLPVVNSDAARLAEVELRPFQALVEGGTGGMMVGHLKVPALDASPLPASLSRPIVTGLLRDRMGFDGLIFTDALEMSGAQVKGASNCVLALKAGADVLLGSSNPSADIDSVMKALRGGRLDSREVEASVRRVLAWKHRLGLHRAAPVAVAGALAEIAGPEAAAVGQRLARATVTVVRNTGALLPLEGASRVVVTGVGAPKGDDTFTGIARSLCGGVETVAQPDQGAVDRADAMIVAVYSTGAAAVESVRRLARLAPGKTVVVYFGNPYKLAPFAKALGAVAAVVVAGDSTPAIREAAANAIFGASDATGRMPVGVDGVAREGEGVDLIRGARAAASVLQAGHCRDMALTIDSLVDRGIGCGAFTGCRVLVVKDGATLYDRAAGTVDGRGSAPVTSSTLFDLASVSKVAGTLAGLMAAYDRGMFCLDDTLARFIPELAGDPKGRLTMRQLMFHETGLPPSLNTPAAVIDPASLGDAPIYSSRRDALHTIPFDGLWANASARLRPDLYASRESSDFDLPVASGIFASKAAPDTIMARVFAVQPSASKAYRYSDLNFILLMEAAQRMTGRPFDEWVDETVYAPLGIARMAYRPLDLFDKDEIAATERDPFLRRQKVHGYVHDETAAFMGGVAGSAGLFADAPSLAAFCRMLIEGGCVDGRRVLKQSTVDAFLTPRSAGGRRGLGFDTAASGRFIGHTGFTGTCFWIDPARGLTVVVLTNRVNPTRDNAAWRSLNFRGRVLEAVDGAIG